jgi:hypothetical protein
MHCGAIYKGKVPPSSYYQLPPELLLALCPEYFCDEDVTPNYLAANMYMEHTKGRLIEGPDPATVPVPIRTAPTNYKPKPKPIAKTPAASKFHFNKEPSQVIKNEPTLSPPNSSPSPAYSPLSFDRHEDETTNTEAQEGATKNSEEKVTTTKAKVGNLDSFLQKLSK